MTGSGEPMHRVHIVGQGNAQKPQDRGSNGGRVFPCVYFNKGACLQKQTHGNKGVTYRHICSLCWNKEGRMFGHPQVECRKFQGNVKNDVKKKQVSGGTTPAGRTQVTRFFINSSVNALEVDKLLRLNVLQAKLRADRALVFCNATTTKSFASVVAGKGDRDFLTSTHKESAGRSKVFNTNAVSLALGKRVHKNNSFKAHTNVDGGAADVQFQDRQLRYIIAVLPLYKGQSLMTKFSKYHVPIASSYWPVWNLVVLRLTMV